MVPSEQKPFGNKGAVDDGARAEIEKTSAQEPVVAEPAGESPDDLRAKIESLEDSLLRAKADYQNLKRRATVEQVEAVRYANAELMRSLLVVMDDLERSLEAAEKTEDLSALKEGVRLAYENLRKALGDHGLSAIEALREPFDPAVHNAMMQKETREHPPGTVVGVLAKGYKLRDRVLRPSVVVVAKEPAGDNPEESAPPKESDE